MPLIIEDGTMPEEANSYASLVQADVYLMPRGLWPVTGVSVDTEAGTEVPDAEMVARKESSLMRATDYLNSLQWKGFPSNWERLFAWPRNEAPLPQQHDIAQGTVPENTVPAAVAVACMEMAAVIFSGTNPMACVERGGLVTSESHSVTTGGVDVIGGDSKSDSYTYAPTAPTDTYYPQLRAIEAYLEIVPGKARGFYVLNVVRG